MIFLFEQFSYSLDYLKKVLPTDSVGRFKGLPNGFVGRDCKLDGVGYFYYIEETFGFKIPKSEFYAPIRVNEFRRLLGHRGLVELRRIKHKYFADRFLKLYNIVKAFFEWGGTFSANDFESGPQAATSVLGGTSMVT